MSMPDFFSWEVITAPFDEAEVENHQTLEQDPSGDYFNIKIRVKHEVSFAESQPQLPPSITSFDFFSFEDSMLVPSQDFFKNGTSYLLMLIPDHIIARELIPSLMSEFIINAETMAQNCHSGESPHFRVFTLILDIVIESEYDDDITNRIMRESMEEVEMVPVSKTAIESLKRVKLTDNAKESCRICLTEFDDGMEVSLMPCNHVYHQKCLIVWLKTSHMCPLCRYPMPT